MPWNGKTTRRDRKRRHRSSWLHRFPRRLGRFRRLMLAAPLPPKPQFVVELFNLDGYEK